MLKFEQVPHGAKGYDAMDSQWKRVQINLRAPSRGAGSVNRGGRIGRFSNWDLDYAFLVLLNEDYEMEAIWRVDRLAWKTPRPS